MQTAAERVDSDLREYLAGAGLEPAARRCAGACWWRSTATSTPNTWCASARRFAERRQAPWTVAYVDVGSPRTDHERLARRRSSSPSGWAAKRSCCAAPTSPTSCSSYAARNGVSSILIGQTQERPIARIFNRTITQQLLRKGAHFELTIVRTPQARARARRSAAARGSGPGALRRTALAALVTAVPRPSFRWLLDRTSRSGAWRWSSSAASCWSRCAPGCRSRLLAALLGFVAYNFFFTEPRLTLRIDRAQESSPCSLSWSPRWSSASSPGASTPRWSPCAPPTSTPEPCRPSASAWRPPPTKGRSSRPAATSWPPASAARRRPAARRRGRRPHCALAAASVPPDAELGANDLAAADWVARSRPTGGPLHRPPCPAPRWWFVPLIVEGGAWERSACASRSAAPRLAPEQRALAEAVVHQVAQAAERTRLVANLEAARVEGETERLRTALLSSVSHDLRSPLSAVIGAATSLAAYGDSLPAGRSPGAGRLDPQRGPATRPLHPEPPRHDPAGLGSPAARARLGRPRGDPGLGRRRGCAGSSRRSRSRSASHRTSRPSSSTPR